jgi:hypothetical protein
LPDFRREAVGGTYLPSEDEGMDFFNCSASKTTKRITLILMNITKMVPKFVGKRSRGELLSSLCHNCSGEG